MADFHSWAHETLARFAEDAQRELQAQAEEIKRLQMQVDWLEQDRRECLDGYRDLLRRLGAKTS